jgi:predicted hydrocarbon binding protein
MYEMMTEECLPKYIERNCTYRLFSLDEKGCVVDVFPNPDVQDALKTKAFGNPHFCATKVGVTASVTAYKNLPFAKVIETKCVHQGSPFCRFEVDYSLPEQAMQKRQRASS